MSNYTVRRAREHYASLQGEHSIPRWVETFAHILAFILVYIIENEEA